MTVTHPWLAGPSPKKRLDRERLEERIEHWLRRGGFAPRQFWTRSDG
ncbi:hypothetical protein [Streptomyces sp. SS]|nr:hypothetical protein [Streptomyces sp. SS]